jgi:hypothetical protein
MPTREQIESVVAEIERLQSGGSGNKPWAALTHGEKYVALAEIEWPGFTRKEELGAIARILADEPPEVWMEGIGSRDDDPLPSPGELRSLAEEIRQDEHAARVRYYGEADAATYDARMAEAYRHRSEALGLAGAPERPMVTDAELERLVGELERSWAARAELIADFVARIEQLRREGVLSYEEDRKTPWAEISETHKLEFIVEAAQKVWLPTEKFAPGAAGPEVIAVPGVAALEAVENNIDYGKLPPAQRELLLDLRVMIDTGEFIGDRPDRKDLTALALGRIVGVGRYEETFGWWKERDDTPWAEVPEADQVWMLAGMAADMGPPGRYTLGVIEREVEYGALPPWRREALVELRTRSSAGELDGENPNPLDLGDRADYELRLTELKARVEDHKQLGAVDDVAWHWPWRELAEEVKFDLISADIDKLHLKSEASAYEILGREVDLTRVSQEQRRDFEDGRRLAWPRPAMEKDAFDRVAANPSLQWYEDGNRSSWEDLPADNQVAYLASYAARHDVSFDRFTDAARRLFGMGPGQRFTADDEWHLRGQFRMAHQNYSGNRDAYDYPLSGRAKPDRGVYQVWHDRGWPARRTDQLLDPAQTPRFPGDYVHAANVRAVGLVDALEKTTHAGHPLGDEPFQRWDKRGAVQSFAAPPFRPRDTTTGDVIVDPHGQAHLFFGRGFVAINAAPRQRIPSSGTQPAEGVTAQAQAPSPGELAAQGHEPDIGRGDRGSARPRGR